MKSSTVTVSSKYQIVIPAELRESMHIRPGSKLTLVELGGQVRLLPVLPASAYRGIARQLSNTDMPSEPERF